MSSERSLLQLWIKKVLEFDKGAKAVYEIIYEFEKFAISANEFKNRQCRLADAVIDWIYTEEAENPVLKGTAKELSATRFKYEELQQVFITQLADIKKHFEIISTYSPDSRKLKTKLEKAVANRQQLEGQMNSQKFGKKFNSIKWNEMVEKARMKEAQEEKNLLDYLRDIQISRIIKAKVALEKLCEAYEKLGLETVALYKFFRFSIAYVVPDVTDIFENEKLDQLLQNNVSSVNILKDRLNDSGVSLADDSFRSNSSVSEVKNKGNSSPSKSLGSTVDENSDPTTPGKYLSKYRTWYSSEETCERVKNQKGRTPRLQRSQNKSMTKQKFGKKSQYLLHIDKENENLDDKIEFFLKAKDRRVVFKELMPLIQAGKICIKKPS